MPYVYILECIDGSYYTGSTWFLDERVLQHQNGQGSNYTKKRLPVKLVYYEEWNRIDDAFRRERQIHGWNRRKKLALIQGNVDLLVEISKSYSTVNNSLDVEKEI